MNFAIIDETWLQRTIKSEENIPHSPDPIQSQSNADLWQWCVGHVWNTEGIDNHLYVTQFYENASDFKLRCIIMIYILYTSWYKS